jgi:peroxiredoxin
MTAPLDSEDTDHTSGCDPGESAAGAREARAESEASPLRQQVRDRELAQRLERRLLRRELPDVELKSLHGTRVPIRQHTSGRVIIDFLPGERTAQDGDRMAARQAHLNRLQALQAVQARPISVISAVAEALDLSDPYFDPGGLTLCDPELLITDALGLPTVKDGDARHYRRLSLITRRGRIEKVIFPAEQDIEKHTRRVISWMQVARW